LEGEGKEEEEQREKEELCNAEGRRSTTTA